MSDRRQSLFSRFMGLTTPAQPRHTPSPQTTASSPARPRVPATDKPAALPPTESQTKPNAPTTSNDWSNIDFMIPTRNLIFTIIKSSPKPSKSSTNPPLANAPDSKAPRLTDELKMAGDSKNSTPAVPTKDSTKVLSSDVQSRLPSLPSSPSRVAPQPQSTPLSPSRMSTQPPSTPPLRSPSRVSSPSAKPTSSPSTTRQPAKSSPRESLTKSRSNNGTASPPSSKESRRSIDQEINNPPASAKESNPTEHLERRLEAEIVPNHDLNDRKEVKVVQATNTEHDEHNAIKKDLSKPHAMPINVEEALEKKEILSPHGPNNEPINSPISQVPNKNMIPDTDNNLALNKDIKKDLSTFANRMAIPDHSKTDKTPSVITLAGENRGAVMQIGSNSSQREGPVHINRGYKLNSETTIDEDQENDKENKSKGSKNGEDQPAKMAYVNNNTQAMNNSIVLSCSLSERDPGVHIVIAKESASPTKPAEARKVEFNTSASKVAHQPTVRRRCLRGMLLESSDSDPEKPRRHGCRVAIKETAI